MVLIGRHPIWVAVGYVLYDVAQFNVVNGLQSDPIPEPNIVWWLRRPSLAYRMEISAIALHNVDPCIPFTWYHGGCPK
jgi:hypothetical protein